MAETTTPPEKSSWKRRLAIFFAILFAIFWSLGSFFFWTLLALAFYFGFLSFLDSRALDSLMDSFRNQQAQARNPNRSYQPRPETVPPPDGANRLARIVRTIIYSFFALFLFFFLIGIFFGKKAQTPSESTESTEVITADEEPDDGTTQLNDKGNAALGDKKYDSAIWYYDKALKIDPENRYALYNKGLTYTLQQDYRRGNSFAKKCVRYHDEYNPAWWLLGYNYDLLSNPDSAMYCLERAYARGYSQPDFLQLVAEVYVKKDKRTKAVEAYKKVLEQDSARVEVYTKLAELEPSKSDWYRKKANAVQQAPH